MMIDSWFIIDEVLDDIPSTFLLQLFVTSPNSKLPQEHITSDIGSVGDFAAGSEVAFGTILQRTYSVLGARMHYGHPDIMNKQLLEE